MKKPTTLLSLLVILILLSLTTQSQTLSPTVISSSGGYFTSANGSLSFTVAEMTMVQTFIGTNNILTQGFQQPEDFSVSLTENEVPLGGVLIYPNPTSGQFSLAYNSEQNKNTTVKIYNLVGQVIYSESYTSTTGMNTLKFDISNNSQGIYMLEISSAKAKDRSVHKINLVY